MVNANELRLGNWVQHEPYPDEIWQVDYKLFESIDLQLVECVGIPLTPEILEKAGFEKLNTEMSGCKVYQKDFWRVAYSYRDENCFKLWHRQVSPPTWRLAEFAYIHQLQNLYFALTGEELTLTYD